MISGVEPPGFGPGYFPVNMRADLGLALDPAL